MVSMKPFKEFAEVNSDILKDLKPKSNLPKALEVDELFILTDRVIDKARIFNTECMNKHRFIHSICDIREEVADILEETEEIIGGMNLTEDEYEEYDKYRNFCYNTIDELIDSAALYYGDIKIV